MNLTSKTAPGQRRPAVISQAIRRSAKGQSCTLRIPGVCSRDPGHTMACHIQAPGMGVMAGKASDLHVVYGCARCHAILDSRDRWADAAVGWDDVLRAMIETQNRLLDAGLIEVK